MSLIFNSPQLRLDTANGRNKKVSTALLAVPISRFPHFQGLAVLAAIFLSLYHPKPEGSSPIGSLKFDRFSVFILF
jgi:hypothetical protein